MYSRNDWKICGMCGWVVICRKCGMNTCSGGYGTLPDGTECDQCPKAYEAMHKADADGTAPKETEEEAAERGRKCREAMLAAGVKFGTLDDILDI